MYVALYNIFGLNSPSFIVYLC